jgi:hypothetical protein
MNSPIVGFVDADLEVLLNSYPLSETRFIPIMRGSVIQFEGVPTAFTKEPFMLTFAVSMTKRSHIIAGRSH